MALDRRALPKPPAPPRRSNLRPTSRGRGCTPRSVRPIVRGSASSARSLAAADRVRQRGFIFGLDDQSYGAEHPYVARNLNNLASLLKATNRLAEAEPLMRRAVEICNASLGPDHPHTKTASGNLRGLLAEMKKGNED